MAARLNPAGGRQQQRQQQQQQQQQQRGKRFTISLYANASHRIPSCPKGYIVRRHLLKDADDGPATQELKWLYSRHNWTYPVVRTHCSSRTTGRAAAAANAAAREAALQRQVAPLVEQNLRADIGLWAPRLAEALNGRLSARALLEWARSEAVERGERKLVLVRGRRVLLPLEAEGQREAGCPRPCEKHMARIVAQLREWVAQGGEGGAPMWPQGLYIINTRDIEVCPEMSSSCQMPVLSLIKTVSPRRTSPDILVPHLYDMNHPLYQFPWRLKEPKALFRGSGYCQFATMPYAEGVCSRLYLANLTSSRMPPSKWATHDRPQGRAGGGSGGGGPFALGGGQRRGGGGEGDDYRRARRTLALALGPGPGLASDDERQQQQRRRQGGGGAAAAGGRRRDLLTAGGGGSGSLNPLPIDVGMVVFTERGPRGPAKEVSAPGRGPLPLAACARFKALLSLDGLSASYRLGKLLHMGSAVLKQASYAHEWYYRSLVEGRHYASFWNTGSDDVLQVAGSLLDGSPESEALLQLLAREGGSFALRYLSVDARQAYWREALAQYRGLFDAQEMAALVAELDPGA